MQRISENQIQVLQSNFGRRELWCLCIAVVKTRQTKNIHIYVIYNIYIYICTHM